MSDLGAASSDRPAREQSAGAIDLVMEFLGLVEARRLTEAGRFLSSEVEIVFPGGRRFASLDEQVASSAGRFRSVRKSHDSFDVAVDGDRTIVYVFGTLEGEDVEGQAFASVRFIDRFVLVDGLIRSHMVWNDLAECGVVRIKD